MSKNIEIRLPIIVSDNHKNQRNGDSDDVGGTEIDYYGKYITYSVLSMSIFVSTAHKTAIAVKFISILRL